MTNKNRITTFSRKKNSAWTIMTTQVKSTSPAKKSETNTEYVIQHSSDGQMKEKLKPSAPSGTKDFMDVMTLPVSSESKVLKRKREVFVTPELPVKNKKETSKDKWKTSDGTTPVMKSFKTLDQGSTLKGKDLKPWWTKSCLEISKKLSSVTVTDLSDSDMHSLNKYAKSLSADSWFKVKMSTAIQPMTLPKTYYPSLQYLPPNIMDSGRVKKKEKEKKQSMTELNPIKKVKLQDKESIKKEPAEKCLKIRLYPSEAQRSTLNRWMGCARWTYNQCLSGINNDGIKKSKKELRKHCISSKSEIIKKNTWTKGTPYDIRDEAMCDLLKAYKTCLSVGDKFKMRYKTRKDNKDSIVLHSKHFNATRKRMLKKEQQSKSKAKEKKETFYDFIVNIKSSEPLPEYLEYDSRIIKDTLNHYWMCIPIRLSKRTFDNQEMKLKSGKIASIDPGNRTFVSIYDSDGVCLEVAKGDYERINRLGHEVDKLQSKWSQKNITHKKRYKLKKAAKNIRKKIKNLVKDVHDKLIKYLVTNYSLILLPIFETQKMVARKTRKIRSKTARSLITWSHFSFRQRLINKLNEYKEVSLKIVTEEYTSITCGECGKLHQKLHTNKTFICPSCFYKADRDLNAARNIMIKSLNMSRDICPDVETQLLSTF